MNVVFEPTLLFITEDNWNDIQKQDLFLEQLLCHLETVDKYDICEINWSDELQLNLVEQPEIHPWFQSDLRNPLIATIHQKLYSRQTFLPSSDIECTIEPPLLSEFPETDVNSNFKKLLHSLIEFEETFYLCVGSENISQTGSYTMNCLCHSSYSPVIINTCKDWLSLLDVVELFYPQNTREFDERMHNAIEFIRAVEFQDKIVLFQYEFSNQFKRDIIRAVNHRDKILRNITKKLISTAVEAGQDSQLRDEYIERVRQYRFRVTNRPFSTRIHYIIENSKIVFKKYYDEGEHDTGL